MEGELNSTRDARLEARSRGLEAILDLDSEVE